MMVLAAYLLGLNTLSFSMFAEDKLVAKGWLPFLGRIPEALLHQAELGGGTLGSFLAQRLFRHKTSKVSYQRRFSQILFMQEKLFARAQIEGIPTLHISLRHYTMAAGSAWWYFQGLSWALVGAELLSGLMFLDTVRRIGRLNNNYTSSSSSDWKYRLDRRGDKRSRQQPWQRPVSVTGGRPTRFGGGTEQGWRGTK